jgi:hypothetical protein
LLYCGLTRAEAQFQEKKLEMASTSIIVFAAFVAAAAAGGLPAAKYPAGVNPAECPDYPYCHNGIYGNHAVGAYSYAVSDSSN